MSIIKPIHYTLEFAPNFKTFKFQGKETLTFKVVKPTSVVALDCVDITVQSCILQSTDHKIIEFKNNSKTLTIHFDKPLKKGTYNLSIDFIGELKNNLAGFYRSRVETTESEQYIATTQFEAADARRTFPCVDHPSYKATFDVRLVVDADMTAVSNTVVTKEELLPTGKKRFTFETTPLMSTYLLYLGAGKFEMYEDTYKNVQIRGIATPGKAQYTKFAVECTKKSLEYFEKYFSEPYPLKKLDVIAVPDFAAGAMENWGAITFRENLVLFYEDSSSITTKQRIAEVVAHEVAHQWFGNLVTMKWWDDLWLNESFATFMAYKVVDHYWPEWNIWTEYVLMTVFPGMKLDSLQSSHPIHVNVDDPTEMSELFDEIAYDKGGSILRMIEGYLGESSFRDGLRKYIQKYKYSNTEGKNLWNSLEAVSGKPIKSIMESQIKQTGFPYLAASKNKTKLQMKQSRFLMKQKESSDETWNLPLTIKLGSDTKNILMKTKTSEMDITKDSPLYINKNYNSFFISNYSDELLQSLGHNIQQLSDIEKLGLIHDIENLVFAGKKKLSDFLMLLENYFLHENSLPVILYIVEKLNKIYLLSNDKRVGKVLQTYAKKGIKKTGYTPIKNEHPYQAILRTTSLFALSLFDDEDVKKFATQAFASYLDDEKSLHPDLRTVIYSLAVWFDDSAYETIMQLYKKSSIQEEKVNYLTALGNTKNRLLLEKSLALALSDEVRFNQLPFIIFSSATNPYAKDMTLDWLLAHWNDLITKSGGTINHIFRRILQRIIPTCGAKRVTDVQTFIQTHSTKELAKTFEQVIEALDINVKFLRNIE